MISLNDLQSRVESGLIEVVEEDPYRLYNYSADCQFKKQWDHISRMCRGLIVHKDTGEILARPFTKFFNYGEMPESTNLPDEDYVVYPKWDGSLGICWYDPIREDWRITTRGSFNSEQGQWATKFLNEHPTIKDKLCKGFTYLFEIIYPSNRIVVNYGDMQELVILAIIENETGQEVELAEVLLFAIEAQCYHPWTLQKAGPFGKQNTVEDLLKICEILPANEEGFVIRFESGLRVKIKGETYKAVHRLKSRLTPKGVWEILYEGLEPAEILRNIPDEFFQEFMAIADSYLSSIESFKQDVLLGYNTAPKGTRKEFALSIKDKAVFYKTAMFLLFDGKEPDYRKIWLKGNQP